MFNWNMETFFITFLQLNVPYLKLDLLQLIVYQLNFSKTGSTNRYPHLPDEEKTKLEILYRLEEFILN